MAKKQNLNASQTTELLEKIIDTTRSPVSMVLKCGNVEKLKNYLGIESKKSEHYLGFTYAGLEVYEDTAIPTNIVCLVNDCQVVNIFTI